MVNEEILRANRKGSSTSDLNAAFNKKLNCDLSTQTMVAELELMEDVKYEKRGVTNFFSLAKK